VIDVRFKNPLLSKKEGVAFPKPKGFGLELICNWYLIVTDHNKPGFWKIKLKGEFLAMNKVIHRRTSVE